MSVSLEHDYLGLSSNSMERSDRNGGGLNFKATELRLGLPGSKSPERGCGLKSLSSAGAKRGFSDALEGGSGSGSEPGDLGKDVAASDGKTQQMGFTLSALKDSSPQNPINVHEKKPQASAPAAKAQVVGWPPVRSFRKNSMAQKSEDKSGSGCLYVKVSMDGAPYLRKVDLKTYGSYMDLSSALEKMFRCFTIRQCGSHGVSGRDGLSESRLMDLLQGAEYVLTYEDKDGDWMLVGDVPWDMFTESCKRMRIMKSSDAIGLAPRAMEKCKNRN